MRSNLAGCIWQNSTRKEWNFKISRFSADIVEFKILKFICSAQQNGILKFLANYKIQKQAKLNLCRATEFRDKSRAFSAKFCAINHTTNISLAQSTMMNPNTKAILWMFTRKNSGAGLPIARQLKFIATHTAMMSASVTFSIKIF